MQLLFLYLTFYQQKFGKKIMLQQILSGIDKIKVVVSKCSTNRTMCNVNESFNLHQSVGVTAYANLLVIILPTSSC